MAPAAPHADSGSKADANGVSASTLHLPAGPWTTLLQGLCGHFPQIGEAVWRSRFARGRVQDERGVPLTADSPYREGTRIRYFREVSAEEPVPFQARILYSDDDILIADKPHFLPVVPAGRHVEETLLTRLIRETGNHDLVPLHRIDRATAGLVMFSARVESRRPYQDLFRKRLIEKEYEAWAGALPELAFPYSAEIRLAEGSPFFRMQAVAGPANAWTRIEPITRGEHHWRYRLWPVTGRKHQLRVQMAALGAAIVNDDLYPELQLRDIADYSRPLALVARALRFQDPSHGGQREFVSACGLAPPA